jgi:RNA polymerase sigma factor (TIGR02999 family)
MCTSDWRAGGHEEPGSFEMSPDLYDALHRLAEREFRNQPPGHTLQPTALLSEAFLKMWAAPGGAARWQDERHFLAAAAGVMRQVLVSHARAKGAEKRGGRHRQVTLEGVSAAAGTLDFDILDLDEAMGRLAKESERSCRVAELRLFAGLTTGAIADLLSVSEATVKGDWSFARARLAASLLGDHA